MEPATKNDLKDFLKELRESIKEAVAEAFGNSMPALEHATTSSASQLLAMDVSDANSEVPAPACSSPNQSTSALDLGPTATSAQPLDIDATGVVPPTPTTCSTECPSRDATASTSVFTLGMTPTSATATIDVTPVLAASVVTKDFTTPSRLLQAAAPALIHELRVLQPAPWPSFKCHSRAADTTKPLPWLSYMWRIGPVQKDACPQSEIKALVSNMSMVCGNRSSSHSYISGNILLSPSGIWCLRDLFLSPMSCWPDIQYVQQTNAVLEAPLCPERHNIRICRCDVAPSEPALGLALGVLTQTKCSTEGFEVSANSMVLASMSGAARSATVTMLYTAASQEVVPTVALTTLHTNYYGLGQELQPLPWPSFDCSHRGMQLKHVGLLRQITYVMAHFPDYLNSLRDSRRYLQSVQRKPCLSEKVVYCIHMVLRALSVPSEQIVQLMESVKLSAAEWRLSVSTKLQGYDIPGADRELLPKPRPLFEFSQETIQLKPPWPLFLCKDRAVHLWSELPNIVHEQVKELASCSCREKLWGTSDLVYKSQEHWNFYGHHLLEYNTPVCTIPRPDKLKGTMQIMNMAVQWKFFRQAEFQGSGCFAKQCGSEQYGTQRQSWRPLDQATSNAKQLGQECYSQTVMQETLCLGTFPTHADYLIYMDFINIALMGLEVIHSKQFNYKTQCLQSYSCYVLQPWEGTEYLVHCNASSEFYLEKFALVRKLDRSGSTNSVVSVIASLVHISNTCSLGDILVLTWRSQGLSLEQLQGETPSHDILVLTWLGSSTSYRSCVCFPLPPAKPPDDQDKCTFHWVKIQHMILVSLYFVSRSLYPSAAPFELYDTSLPMEMISHIIFINWIFCAWDKICVVMEVDPMPSTAAWKKCGCRHLPGAYNLWLDYIFAQRISQNWAWRLYLNELRPLAYLGTADSSPASRCISTVLVDDPVRRWVIHICAILRAGGDQCKCQWSARCFIGKWVEETGRSQNSESMDIVLLHCYAWGLLIADFLQVSIGSCLNGYSRMCGFVLLQWEIAWTLGSASGTQSRQPFLPPTVRSAASTWKQEGTQGGMCDMAPDTFLDQAQVRHGCYIDHAYYYFPPRPQLLPRHLP